MMPAALATVIALAWRTQRLDRPAEIACLARYPVFVTLVLTT